MAEFGTEQIKVWQRQSKYELGYYTSTLAIQNKSTHIIKSLRVYVLSVTSGDRRIENTRIAHLWMMRWRD